MKRRLYLSIDSKLFEKLQVAADKREVSKSEVVTDALDVELEQADLRNTIQTLENKLDASISLRKIYQEENKSVKNQNDAIKEERDLFKQKFEEAVANLQYAEAKLTAYQRQNWFQRLFNRPLAILPYDKVEPRKGDTPTPTLAEHE